MQRISQLVVLLFTISLAQAQTSTNIFERLETPNGSEGTIRIIQDDGVAEMVKQHIEQNKKSAGIDGYRIQLYSGSGDASRREAENIKGQMMSAFPNQKVYLTYTAPFWRVRTGNYRNKSELLYEYQQLKSIFPNCYPIRDNTIRYTDLQ